jgi:hypothetical protein
MDVEQKTRSRGMGYEWNVQKGICLIRNANLTLFVNGLATITLATLNTPESITSLTVVSKQHNGWMIFWWHGVHEDQKRF